LELPLELVGELPGPWADDLSALAQQALGHDWGGMGPQRLVLVQLVAGGFFDALQRYMKQDEFEQFMQKLGPDPRIAAKTFRAVDGQVTCAMLPLPRWDAFFTMFAQQHMSAAAMHREAAEHYVWPQQDPGLSNGHVLWQHYTTERARREVTDSLEWDLGGFDNTELVSEAADVETQLLEAAARPSSGSLPDEAGLRAWLMLLRVWCAGLGCADAGAVPYALELRRFREQPFASATSAAWDSAASALRAIWSNPGRSTSEHDEFASTELWQPLEVAMREIWATVRGLNERGWRRSRAGASQSR
jgi:hypothetical protein